ncbi:MAG: GGDEF domain-containing protein [Clostridia bacterium]|nr:GGDEF domain-containing protein [Clostridia bacterium]
MTVSSYRESINEAWRVRTYRVCLMFAVIVSVLEIGIYLYGILRHEAFFLSKDLYRFRFMYLPILLNGTALFGTRHVLRDPRVSDARKTLCICILVWFLCAVVQCVHYVYGPVLPLPVLAIFVAGMYGERRFIRYITAASFASLLLAGVLCLIELRRGDAQAPLDVLIAGAILLASYLASCLFCEYVTQQLQMVEANNQRQRELMAECNLDPLMGIYNRKALSGMLDRLVREFLPGRPNFLFMLDIDDFKTVNDVYGHLAGDDVLINLSSAVKSECSGDNVSAYRYGGDEIIVMMENMTPADAVHIARGIQRRCDSIFKEMKEPPVHFSAGLVRYEPGMSVESWIASADQALYEAKAAGKNQIVVKASASVN